MSVVEQIYSNNLMRERVRRTLRSRPVRSLRKSVETKNSMGKLGLIVEFKRRSPSGFNSEGNISPENYFKSIDCSVVAGFSVLTEPDRFGGSWADLEESQKFDVPVLAKDFFGDRNMIHDAYHCGADAVLLIADFLSGERLAEYADEAKKLGMDALIEFHDPECASRIPLEKNVLVGYNRRNLRTMKMEGKEKEVSKLFNREDMPYILESGINTDNARTMDFTAFSGLLIGSSIISGESVIEVLQERDLL